MQLHQIRNLTLQLFLFVLISVLLLGCSMFDYSKEIGKGQENYVKGNYDVAVVHFIEALKIARKEKNYLNEWETLGNLARTYSAQGLNEKAEATFKERILIADINKLDDNTFAESYIALTMHYLSKSKCQEANDIISKMTEHPHIFNTQRYNESRDVLSELSRYKGCSK